jgi:hypothetical protein
MMRPIISKTLASSLFFDNLRAMTKAQDKGFKQTLRRMLSAGPIPHETSGKK